MKIKQVYKNICLIEKKEDNTAQELKDAFPGCNICVCDFYIKDSEKGNFTEKECIHFEDILIMDHHAPIREMKKHICSTTFATRYVLEHGPLDETYVIIINHTDTDSILSSLIMNGDLEPQDEYNTAAIAADHTGEENIISDLLQSFDKNNNLNLSAEILHKVLRRLWERQKLKAEADSGGFKNDEGIISKVFDKPIDDAGLLPWIFPDSDLIIVAWEMPPGSERKWNIKARLGITTDDIALNEMDLPNTGGRWDAISTTRHGGTDVPFEEYVKLIKDNIIKTRKSNH